MGARVTTCLLLSVLTFPVGNAPVSNNEGYLEVPIDGVTVCGASGGKLVIDKMKR